jgi:glutamyl-tRNA synthetase
MHIGGVRTALYAYLIAKHSGGQFLLRIEDTDRERYVEGAVDAIYRSLRDCGLNWDEGPDVGGAVGPYVQSERRELYREYAERLLELGGAFRDGDAIRQKIPREGSTTFHDAVYGEITVPNDSASMNEGVLLKSDGLPTYNFANVVDDHLMGITHVVRGSEYLSSDAKYDLLYRSFGWEIPTYVTVPLIMRDATHKLSKRAGDPTYEDLIAEGFLPQAILNYVALLGWSPGGEREFYTLPELADAFDIRGISKSPALFDKVKLRYFNAHYIREMPVDELAAMIRPRIPAELDARLLAPLLHQRIETLGDVGDESRLKLRFLWDFSEDYALTLFDNKKAKTNAAVALGVLTHLLPELERLEPWSLDEIAALLTTAVERLELKTGAVFGALRVAVSGESATPGGPAELCEVLGRAESLRRVRIAINRLEQLGGVLDEED